MTLAITDQREEQHVDTDEDVDVSELLDERDSIMQRIEENDPDIIGPSGNVCLSYDGAIRQAVNEQKMSADFVIVTRSGNERNRHGNRVQIVESKNGKGLRLDMGYQANPVVLYDHGFEGGLPVAMSEDAAGKLSVKLQKSKATATAYFRQLPHSEAVFAAVAEGLLRMASIGFDPHKAMLIESDRAERVPDGVQRMGVEQWRGLDFVESELLEWSITPVGADRGSLRQALHRGKIHDVRIPQFLRHSFELHVGPDKVWSPGCDFTRQTIESLGVTIEGSPENVQSVIQRINVPDEPDDEASDDDPPAPAEAATDAPTDDDDSGEMVDGDSPNPTIPEQQSKPRANVSDIANKLRQRTPKPQAKRLPLSRLKDAIGQRIEQKVSTLAKDSKDINTEFQRRTGCVDAQKTEG